VRAASRDPFAPVHWWRASGDALDVLREVLGLVNAGGAASASFALRGQSEKEKPLAPGRNHFIGNFRDMRKVASLKGGQRVFEK
jgi:hypothetical protein